MKIKKLKEIMQKQKLTVYKLSKKSKIGYATLYDIISEKSKNPRIDTITKIANALGIKVESLI